MDTEIVYVQPPQHGPVMQANIIETAINAASPGPYFVYLPGLDIVGLRNTTHAFNTIHAGEAFRITNIRKYTRKGLLPEGAAAVKRQVVDWQGIVKSNDEGFDIPAETTLNVLLGYGSLTGHGFTQISMFDKVEPYEKLFNKLIHPERIQEKTYPKQWEAVLKTGGGMLAIRQLWLAQAQEALQSGRGLLEDYHRALEKVPYLHDIWTRAINSIISPTLEAFIITANNILAKKEEAIQDKEKKGYDSYDNVLMWLLGRQPERTALARTMKVMEQGGNGNSNSGLSVADVQTMIEKDRESRGVTLETFSCPDCGNPCEAVAGGPPRICWRCKYEFRKEGEVVQATADISEQSPAGPTPEDVADLVNVIKPPTKKK